MANAKKKLPSVTSPVGVAAYAWIDKPDTKFSSEDDAQFKMSLVLDPADEGVSEFVEKVRLVGEEFAKETGVELEDDYKIAKVTPETKGTKKKPVKDEFKGKWVFELKSKYKPGKIDSRKNPLPDGAIRSGDLVRVSALVVPYEAFGSGISLKLKGIQLIEKRNAGSSVGDDFDEYEGGYEHEGSDDDSSETGDGADF